MEKLSPQKSIIVGILRDRQWHCGGEWLRQIKDDRVRITELNRGYMKEKGFQIVGKPCNLHPNCPLYMRRAEKLATSAFDEMMQQNGANLKWMDSYVSA